MVDGPATTELGVAELLSVDGVMLGVSCAPVPSGLVVSDEGLDVDRDVVELVGGVIVLSAEGVVVSVDPATVPPGDPTDRPDPLVPIAPIDDDGVASAPLVVAPPIALDGPVRPGATIEEEGDTLDDRDVPVEERPLRPRLVEDGRPVPVADVVEPMLGNGADVVKVELGTQGALTDGGLVGLWTGPVGLV